MGKKNKNRKRNRDSGASSGGSSANKEIAELSPVRQQREQYHVHTSSSKPGSSDTTPNSGSNKMKNKHKKTTTNGNDKSINNPLLQQQEAYLNSLSRKDQIGFFSNTLITPERRGELWMEQAELGEQLVNQYSWATPNSRALRILQEFSPLIEIGCGANAYWCKLMKQAGMDIIGYDVNLQEGGTIGNSSSKAKNHKKVKKHQMKTSKNDDDVGESFLRKGGPEVLGSQRIINSNRTLFLCYPDEDDDVDNNDDDDDENGNLHHEPQSMGWQCLNHYQGTYVIHVGELVQESNLSLDQAPWGRSSSPEFQQRLSSEYHCLLRAELPNWLHVRDTISVWKRSEPCTIVFAADEEEREDDDTDDDEEEEEVEYRHIPPDERLPTDVAAPCLQHLLRMDESSISSMLPKKENGVGLDHPPKTKGDDEDDNDDPGATLKRQNEKGRAKKKAKLKDKKSHATPSSTMEGNNGNDKKEGEYSCPW